MTDSSLIPERQLVFSPALAATIGLEEAVLLQHLGELFAHRQASQRDGFEWLEVERQWLLDSLPFWSVVDLHRISKSLADKGVILVSSPPLHEADKLIFAINQNDRKHSGRTAQRHGDAAASPAASRQQPRRTTGATLIAANWTPSEDILALLAMNHNIPHEFALDQLEDFVLYWQERGEISHAWDNKFRQRVLSRWRAREQDTAQRFSAADDLPFDNNWVPSADALEIMLRSGVSREFIDDAIPEFVLYWRERGGCKTPNSKFIEHIRRQWSRYTSSLSHDTEPQRIADNWQPADDVYDILNLSHIDQDFARELLPEFIVFWRDTNQMHSSWNTKFLQHVKYKWANRHQFDNARDKENASQQRSGSAGSTRSRSLSEDLTDRSWAH